MRARATCLDDAPLGQPSAQRHVQRERARAEGVHLARGSRAIAASGAAERAQRGPRPRRKRCAAAAAAARALMPAASPRRMMEPLPNCASISASTLSRAARCDTAQSVRAATAGACGSNCGPLRVSGTRGRVRAGPWTWARRQGLCCCPCRRAWTPWRRAPLRPRGGRRRRDARRPARAAAPPRPRTRRGAQTAAPRSRCEPLAAEGCGRQRDAKRRLSTPELPAVRPAAQRDNARRARDAPACARRSARRATRAARRGAMRRRGAQSAAVDAMPRRGRGARTACRARARAC